VVLMVCSVTSQRNSVKPGRTLRLVNLESQSSKRTFVTLEVSTGAGARALALKSYLEELFKSLEMGLNQELAPVKLLVLNQNDWSKSSPYPYGFTFYRRLKNANGVIFAPADYPARMLWTYREVILQAQKVGIKAPGTLEEFFDLALGHELGHAVADQLELRTRVRWFDEFLATYLYLFSLKNINPEALIRVLGWAEVFGIGGNQNTPDSSLTKPAGIRVKKAQQRLKQQGASQVTRTDLGAFEFPFSRLTPANQAWFQAKLLQQAHSILEARGIAFVLQAQTHLANAKGRGEISRALLKLEPGLKSWFKVFGS
jgi:hypothetical protein